MGPRQSTHIYRHPTNTTLEQDATIGGVGGSVAGAISGIGYLFVNQVGLRSSITLLGFAVVGGAIVGAIVCIAGTLAVKSLAWLYSRLRKRARQNLAVQLAPFTTEAAASEVHNRRANSRGETQPTCKKSGATLTSRELSRLEQVLETSQAERGRLLEDLRTYDSALTQLEQQLSFAREPSRGNANDQYVRSHCSDTVSQRGPSHAAETLPLELEHFQAQPVHITFRLSDTVSECMISNDNGISSEACIVSNEEGRRPSCLSAVHFTG